MGIKYDPKQLEFLNSSVESRYNELSTFCARNLSFDPSDLSPYELVSRLNQVFIHCINTLIQLTSIDHFNRRILLGVLKNEFSFL